jgi:hypothetical protein
MLLLKTDGRLKSEESQVRALHTSEVFIFSRRKGEALHLGGQDLWVLLNYAATVFQA